MSQTLILSYKGKPLARLEPDAEHEFPDLVYRLEALQDWERPWSTYQKIVEPLRVEMAQIAQMASYSGIMPNQKYQMDQLNRRLYDAVRSCGFCLATEDGSRRWRRFSMRFRHTDDPHLLVRLPREPKPMWQYLLKKMFS